MLQSLGVEMANVKQASNKSLAKLIDKEDGSASGHILILLNE